MILIDYHRKETGMCAKHRPCVLLSWPERHRETYCVLIIFTVTADEMIGVYAPSCLMLCDPK